jgi:hypothetical protein
MASPEALSKPYSCLALADQKMGGQNRMYFCPQKTSVEVSRFEFLLTEPVHFNNIFV